MDVRLAMTKVPRYRWFLWTAFLAAALFFVTQTGILPGGPGGQANKGFDHLDSLMRLIRNDYLEVRDPVAMAEGSYRGLVNSLDPLSAYLPKELAAAWKARTGAETEPGIVILKSPSAFPQVVAVVKDSPADKAGLRIGDVLSAVSGRNTLSLSMTEVKLLLLGQGAEPVGLRVLRGNDTFDLDVARARLFEEPFAFAPPAAGKPAILKIRRIAPGLVSAIRKGVVPGLKSRRTPLVLDLRGVQDGDHAEAAKLANLFIKTAAAGAFESRGGAKDPVSLPAEPELGALPVVVWTGPGTAGPAELAAGLLQEVRQAKIVGFATPGLVGRRTLFELEDGSAVLLTTGVYALPSGRRLWDKGLAPDVAIPADKLDEKTYLEKTLPLIPKL
jgi:carboxyl-terminal processing protease